MEDYLEEMKIERGWAESAVYSSDIKGGNHPVITATVIDIRPD